MNARHLSLQCAEMVDALREVARELRRAQAAAVTKEQAQQVGAAIASVRLAIKTCEQAIAALNGRPRALAAGGRSAPPASALPGKHPVPVALPPAPSILPTSSASAPAPSTFPAPPALGSVPAPSVALVPSATPAAGAARSEHSTDRAARPLPAMGRSVRRLGKWPRRMMTTISAAALALLMALLVALLTPLPELFGRQLLAVQGGSMEPTILIGSVIVVRPVAAAELRPGDIITFADRGRPDVLVTHRIVALEDRGGERVATTKGDANATSDSWNVPVNRAIGKVEFWVPFLGYAMVWLSTPLAKLLALGAVGLIMAAPSGLRRGRARWQVSRAAEEGDPAGRRSEPVDSLAAEIDALLGLCAKTGGDRSAGPARSAGTPIK